MRLILILNWKGRWSVYPESSLETRLGGMEVSKQPVSLDYETNSATNLEQT